MANPRRRKLTKNAFDRGAERPEPQRVGSLVLDRRDRWGPAAVLDLGALGSRPKLAWALHLALSERSEPGGTIASAATLRTIQKVLRDFWAFLDDREAGGEPAVGEARDVTGAILEGFWTWLKGRVSELTAGTRVYTLGTFFEHLRDHHPKLVSPRYYTPRIGQRPSEVRPFSEREAALLERALLKELRAIVERTTTGKDRLLAQGKDPRHGGQWKVLADALWYVVNVLEGEHVGSTGARASAHKSLFSGACNGGWGFAMLYGHLYLGVDDLWVFLTYLGLVTGLNQQPLLEVERNLTGDDPFLPSLGRDSVRVGFVKRRPRHKSFEKVFPARKWSDAGSILLTLHQLTARAARWVPQHEARRLFLAAIRMTRGKRFRPLGPDGTAFHAAAERFVERHGLVGDDGTPLEITYRRLRPTYLTRRFKESGSLARVRQDANHSNADTTLGYVLNEETRPLLEEITVDTFRDMLAFVKQNTLSQSPRDAGAVREVAQLYQITPRRSRELLEGRAEVIFSSCSDFYNRPGGPAATPCDQPWACFTCPNARWVRRNLPALMLLRDFFLSRRGGLRAEDWQAKYGFPFAAITEVILPAFPPGVLARAEGEAARLRDRFHVPFALLS